MRRHRTHCDVFVMMYQYQARLYCCHIGPNPLIIKNRDLFFPGTLHPMRPNDCPLIALPQ